MNLMLRRQLIETDRLDLSIMRKCALIDISRYRFYHPLVGESDKNFGLIRIIDAQFLRTPCYESSQMERDLQSEDYAIHRKRSQPLLATTSPMLIYRHCGLSFRTEDTKCISI